MAEDQNKEQDRNRKARGPPAIAGKPRDKFFFHFAVQCLVWVVEQKHSNAMCTGSMGKDPHLESSLEQKDNPNAQPRINGGWQAETGCLPYIYHVPVVSWQGTGRQGPGTPEKQSLLHPVDHRC
ncbi:predicted protein [Histoplasma capsulatum G186AR]|uniref:Uncharacterized protein n=1 Tax=Ajellomyces capsulatus (strain G186AR / H82 / ATCC MYA-2454 / RMSCC 2432) TaxID=447093 RepID=C0NJQ8_AJECG|nr:uncharacterized protein HCBG_03388 [Histoplasma capsulatum G186AR]EEH08099.1 predicted protein [Histoplasma capsulatum G186AR]